MKPSTPASELRELLRLLISKMGILDRNEASCRDMTLGQCRALIEIGRAEVLSINQLADRLALAKSTVSRSSDRLVLAGLLHREEDPGDRRYVVLKLSATGMQAYLNLEQRMNSYFETIMADIDPTQHEQVLSALRIVTEAVHAKGCC